MKISKRNRPSSERQLAISDLALNTGICQVIGTSPAIRSQIEHIPGYAASDAPLLICGESGTGKEVFAKAIHYSGPRAKRPFVPLNCAALPLELLENELFGHVSGAYTGAGPTQKGLIEQAEGGILFLDEIDCLVLLGQAKLLRFLQECEVRPLGAASVRRANVRIISACNRDLPAALRARTFREDLYYRLSVLTLNLPPLRQIRDDISLLAIELLKRHETSSNPGVTFLPAALKKLNDYDWPGNVRQLENIIRRSLVSNKPMIDASDLDIPVVETSSFKEQKARAIAEFERHYLRAALARHNGNITHAAKEAGKNRRAFFALLSKHHLNSQSSARIQ